MRSIQSHEWTQETEQAIETLKTPLIQAALRWDIPITNRPFSSVRMKIKAML